MFIFRECAVCVGPSGIGGKFWLVTFFVLILDD